MEKPFLPFNDYLGLSSIFKQNHGSDTDTPVYNSSKKVNKTVCDAWIDKRIEEILHQYSLKKSLSKAQDENNVSTVVNQNLSVLDKGCNNNSLLNSVSHNNSIAATAMPYGNIDSSNMIFSSPTQMSKVSSLTNSPITPDSGSWLNSAATASTSNLQVTNASQLISSTLKPLQFGISGVQQAKINDASTTGAINLSSSGLVKDAPQALGLSSNIRSHRRSSLGCSFCRNNKEVDDWVMSHQLKDSLNRVMCPILRSYVCPLCFASGDNAHTLGHCPLNPDKKNSSLPLAVRRRTNATGRVKL